MLILFIKYQYIDIHTNKINEYIGAIKYKSEWYSSRSNLRYWGIFKTSRSIRWWIEICKSYSFIKNGYWNQEILGTRADIASAVLFIVSDAAKYLTGNLPLI